MADPTPHVAIEDEGPVARVTLNHPDDLNRFDDALHVGLESVLRELSLRTDVRAIVLHGAGRAFSAGGDIDRMGIANRDPGARAATIEHGRRLLATLLDIPQPLVVGIQGPAVGLGATIALCGDLLVASRDAFLSDPHVRVGLVAGDGGCLVWPQSTGMHTAKRFLLTGDRLPAADAAALGLVSEVVDAPDDVVPACLQWATRMAELPPLAVQGTKRALNQVLKQRMQEVGDLAFAYESASMASQDHAEAIAAFREKRPGVFDGK